MAKYTVIHEKRAVISRADHKAYRQGEEVDLSHLSEKQIKLLVDQGLVAPSGTNAAKAAVKAETEEAE